MQALIIEDDVSISRLFARCLSAWGWHAAESHSISTALKVFKRGTFDLAVCDVDLPSGDGIFLARALSKARPTLHIVVVSGDPKNLESARRIGIERCLQKPFELDALKALLETAANGPKD